MMRKLSITLLTAILFSLWIPVVSYAVQNILPNSGFETDANNDLRPDGWNFNVYTGTPAITADTTTFREGSRSVKITGSASTDQASVSASYNVAADNGRNYRFSVYQKTSSIVSGDLGTTVRIYFRDAENKNTAAPLFIAGAKGTNDWRKLTASFTIPYGTQVIWIEAFLWKASGTVWWDEANLSVDDLLDNNGLETDADANGLPDGWHINTYSGTPAYQLDGTVSREGSRSIRISGTSPNDRMSLSAPAIDVSALTGQTYRLTLWQKTDGIVSSSFGTSARVLFRDAANQDVVPQMNLQGAKGTADWSKIERTFMIPPGTVRIYVEAFLYQAAGTVWFDDLRLERMSTGLVLNSGFETADPATGTPYGWTKQINDGNATVTLDTYVKKYGNQSLKLSGDSIDDRSSAVQNITIPPTSKSNVFTFSAWVKSEQIVSNGMGNTAAVQFLDSSGNVIGNTLYITGPKGTTDWQQLSQTFQAPEGTASLRLYLFLFFASGTVWWDMADIRPEFVANPSFEAGGSTVGMPDGWTPAVTGGSPVIEWDATAGYEGTHALKMTGTTPQDYASISQTVKLPVHQRSWGYRIRIYQKVQDVVSPDKGTGLRIKFQNDAGQIWRSDIVIRGAKGTKDWSVLETYINLPYNVTQFVLQPELINATGTVWWDMAEVSPVPMIDNYSMDADADANQVPDSWSYTALSGSPVLTLDTTTKYLGSSSARIVAGTTADRSSLSQVIPLPADYAGGGKVSVSYKSEGVSADSSGSDINGARIKLSFLDGAGNVIGNPLYSSVPSGTNNWVTQNLRFLPPAGTAKVLLELQTWKASGTVWWDNVIMLPDKVELGAAFVSGFGTVRQSGRTPLSWVPAVNAAWYTLQYSRDPLFADGTTVTVPNLYRNSYTPNVELAEGLWYARLSLAGVNNAVSGYGPVTKFIVQRLQVTNPAITPNGDGANDSTGLSYTLQNTATVNLTVYNDSNQAVRHLAANQAQAPGTLQYTWDGKDDSGVIVQDGVYTAKLDGATGGQTMPQSVQTIVVDADDTAGYRGLENNKDWSHFYEELKENVARNMFDGIDLATGRILWNATDNTWAIGDSTGYAYLLGYAYHNQESIYYGNAEARNRAVLAFNYAVDFEIEGTGSWANERDWDPNIDRFSLPALIDAYVLLKNDVDAGTETKWREFLRRAAYYQMQTYPYDQYATEYPNQDQDYVQIVGSIGALLNDQTLLDEAHRMLLESQDDINANGGLNYIIKSNPSTGYQAHIKNWVRYYQFTNDATVLSYLEQIKPYYPLAVDYNGTSEYASSPQQKQGWADREEPVSADMVAYYTGDGQNKMVANIEKESYTRKNPVGLVGGLAAYVLSQGMDTSHIAPVKLPDYGVIQDPDVRGFRGRWGNFSVVLTNNKLSNTLAGLQISNDGNINNPRDSALGWVHFESKDGTAGGTSPSDWTYMMPADNLLTGDYVFQPGIIKQNVAVNSKIGVQYTKFVPVPLYFWRMANADNSNWDWETRQTWIVVKDRLIGLHTMSVRDTNTTLNSGPALFARSRFVFGPATGTLATQVNSNDLTGSYNKLGFWVVNRTPANWEFNTTLLNNNEPGSGISGFRSQQQVAIQKKKDMSGNVSWGPYSSTATDQTLSYDAVFFPLGTYASGGAWKQSADNNITFGSPQDKVRLAQIRMDDSSGEVYAVVANHNNTGKSGTFPVQLPDGSYTVKLYTDGSQVPASTQNITVTGGSYSMAYSMNADSAAVYQFSPQ
ncbi:MAG: repeat-associated core domain protein [Paenibacillaceae bacterium]|jgi:hypothetical protein|nr:repeat-associated core domain protein [Paenibacillaceae bacterium]